MTFSPCGLCNVVRTAGQEVGKAVLCHLFHEYWAGLITQYVGTKYQYEVPQAGDVCVMQLTPR
jgi:hypothetical protein